MLRDGIAYSHLPVDRVASKHVVFSLRISSTVLREAVVTPADFVFLPRAIDYEWIYSRLMTDLGILP